MGSIPNSSSRVRASCPALAGGFVAAAWLYRLMLALGLGVAASLGFAGESERVLSISERPDFSVSLQPYLSPMEVAATSSPTEASADVIASLRRRRFEAVPIFLRDQHRFTWLRLQLENPSQEAATVVISNWTPLPYMTIQVNHAAESTTIQAGYFEEKLEIVHSSYFSHGKFVLPPGRSTVILGLKSPYYPVPLLLEIHSAEQFARQLELRTGLLTFYLGWLACVAFLIFTGFFYFRERLIAIYGLSVLAFSALQVFLAGVYLVDQSLLGFVRFMGAKLWWLMVDGNLLIAVLLLYEYFRQQNPLSKRMLRQLTRVGIALIVAMPIAWFSGYAFLLVFISIGCVLCAILSVFACWPAVPRRDRLLSLTYLHIVSIAILLSMRYVGVIAMDPRWVEGLFYTSGFLNSLLSIVMLNDRSYHLKKVRDIFESNLKAIFSPQRVDQIIHGGMVLDTQPTMRRVTIIFVDIAGYSRQLDQQSPEQSFQGLKNLLALLTEIIRQHDGVVDRTLGDGCLAFFGYDMAGGSSESHENLAVECAIQIQRRIVEEIVHGPNRMNLGMNGLRIGVHTATVCIGNIGDAIRYDFTMSGAGVVLASRLETSCEPFKINISQETFDGLSLDFKTLYAFHPKLLLMKHRMTPVACLELDPFVGQPALLQQAKKICSQLMDLERVQDRYYAMGLEMEFKTLYGPMAMVDISVGGLSLRGSTYLGRYVTMPLDFSPFCRLPRQVFVEVVWGLPEAVGSYLHGVRIIGMTDEEKAELFARVKSYLQGARVG